MKTKTSKQPAKARDEPTEEATPDLTDELLADEENDELQIPLQEQENGDRDPEVTDPKLDEVQVWDEAEGLAGGRVEPVGLEDESQVEEELAAEGLDAAEDELRDEEEYADDRDGEEE